MTNCPRTNINNLSVAVTITPPMLYTKHSRLWAGGWKLSTLKLLQVFRSGKIWQGDCQLSAIRKCCIWIIYFSANQYIIQRVCYYNLQATAARIRSVSTSAHVKKPRQVHDYTKIDTFRQMSGNSQCCRMSIFYIIIRTGNILGIRIRSCAQCLTTNDGTHPLNVI